MEQPIKLEHENETYYCVFPGNNEVMLYIGSEGLFSYLHLTDNFTSIHRQKAFQITKGKTYEWIPGRFPEPLENSNFLAPILEKIQTGKQSKIMESATLSNYPYHNDLTLYRLKKLPKKAVTWEALQFLTTPKIWDNELDCELLTLATLITHEQAPILQHLTSYQEKNLQQIPEKLAENMLEKGYLPKNLLVEDAYLKALLQDFCHQLGIVCEIASVQSAQKLKDQLLGPQQSPIEEAIRYLEHLGEEISQQMSLTQSETDFLIQLLMYMGIQHKQLPPNWSQEPIATLLEIQPEFTPFLIKFLHFAKETLLLAKANDLLDFVIRTKIF